MQIKHLEECSTTAGAVATVAQPFETVQKRTPEKKLKGSNLLKGIKTSAKYANSLHESEQVEEGLKFNGGIPDVDHMHGAIMRGGEGMSKVCPHCNGNRYSWTNYEQGKTPNHPWINPNTATLKSKEIPCPACDGGRKKVPEGKKVDRMVGHVKSSEKKLGKSSKEAENIAWATANKRGMLDNKNKKVEEGIGDTIKRGVKSVKRGMQGWGSPQDKPQEIVNRNKSYNNAELSTMRTVRTKTPPPEHSPAGLQRKVIDREMKKRGLDEQGVAEGDVVQFPQKHPWYAAKTCPKCEGSLVGGKTAEGRVKYCMGCGTVYPEPNTNKGVAEGLNEFAPGSSGGESGRWYTDDQMTDLVGDGWWNDLDVSGASIGVPDGRVPKKYMIQQAQAWLDDQGYSVQVLNCKVNDDDMEWYIEGTFHNPGFAEQGVAEADDKKEWQKQNAKPKQLGKTEKYFSTRHTTKDTGAADKEQGVAEANTQPAGQATPAVDPAMPAPAVAPVEQPETDPELRSAEQAADVHYSSAAKRKKSIEKFLLRSVKHAKEADTEQNIEIRKIKRDMDAIRQMASNRPVAEAGKKSGPINMVGPDKNKHVDVSANPSVAQSNDPELRRKTEWAQRHYGATLSPDEAMNKWMQRGLDITEKNDKRHDAEIAKLMKEIAGLKRIINNLHPHATGASNVAEGEITEDDVVLSADRRRPKSGLLSKPEQAMNPADVVKLDVPLLIRLLEFAKEDAADDMALHDLAEKLVAGCQRGRTLTMKDYDNLVPSPEAPAPDEEEQEDFEGKFNQEMDEISNPAVKSYLGKAMQDTITGKKDRNPGMKRAISRLAGTNKPLTK